MFYSQHGEDIVLSAIFEDTPHGFFIEIGCIDGKRFSNTLHFEEKGWTGICVEAHEDYIELVKRNRPNSIVLHCAAGKTDQPGATFYATSRGSLSTLDKTQEAVWQREFGDTFKGFTEQSVEVKCLDTILEESPGSHIDILSIDVEGTELDVLEGLDLPRQRPGVIVAEASSDSLDRSLRRHLIERGYAHLLSLSSNLVFVPEEDLTAVVGRLEHAVLEESLVHTPHPLDSAEPTVREVRLTVQPLREGSFERLWRGARSFLERFSGTRSSGSFVLPALECKSERK